MIEFAVEHKHILPDVENYPKWLALVALKFNKTISDITYVLTSDEQVYKLNLDFLGHDYYTDVLTFDRSVGDSLSGDIYVSLDRVKENAERYNETFAEELRRVMVHGMLHLIGIDDKNEEDEQRMRRSENEALELFHVKQ